jgi:hypothetical protein
MPDHSKLLKLASSKNLVFKNCYSDEKENFAFFVNTYCSFFNIFKLEVLLYGNTGHRGGGCKTGLLQLISRLWPASSSNTALYVLNNCACAA